MVGITFALWDNVDHNFVSWSWRSFKIAREETLSLVNHKAVSILKVQNNTILYEVNREVGKQTSRTRANIKLAQSKLY